MTFREANQFINQNQIIYHQGTLIKGEFIVNRIMIAPQKELENVYTEMIFKSVDNIHALINLDLIENKNLNVLSVAHDENGQLVYIVMDDSV